MLQPGTRPSVAGILRLRRRVPCVAEREDPSLAEVDLGATGTVAECERKVALEDADARSDFASSSFAAEVRRPKVRIHGFIIGELYLLTLEEVHGNLHSLSLSGNCDGHRGSTRTNAIYTTDRQGMLHLL